MSGIEKQAALRKWTTTANIPRQQACIYPSPKTGSAPLSRSTAVGHNVCRSRPTNCINSAQIELSLTMYSCFRMIHAVIQGYEQHGPIVGACPNVFVILRYTPIKIRMATGLNHGISSRILMTKHHKIVQSLHILEHCAPAHPASEWYAILH